MPGDSVTQQRTSERKIARLGFCVPGGRGSPKGAEYPPSRLCRYGGQPEYRGEAAGRGVARRPCDRRPWEFGSSNP